MTDVVLSDVLLSLLETMNATGKPLYVHSDTVQQWPDGALSTLLEAGILSTAKPALSVECRECANFCIRNVEHLPDRDKKSTRAFVICEDPEMQGQMGRINIPRERLRRWKVTVLQLARVIAELIGIDCKVEDLVGQTNIHIGMVKGKNGRRWLLLNKSPLALEINGHQLPLEEVLFFDHTQLDIDRERIDQLIDKAPGSSGKKYKPSTEKRETRKRKTEAMYKDWQEEYKKLRRKYADTVRHPDNWIAKQIAKLDISQGRCSETIRKNMKP
ncbi:MAG: hypothetical protein ABW087_21245 [Candidatus Thiodiazotropha sp.]